MRVLVEPGGGVDESGDNPRPSKGDDVCLIWSVGIIYVRGMVCTEGRERDREREGEWKKECQLVFLHTHTYTH